MTMEKQYSDSLPYTQAQDVSEVEIKNDTAKVIIYPASTPGDYIHAAKLFTSYAASLPVSLSFQNFYSELDSLPGAYSTKVQGGLWLARLSSPSSSSTSTSFTPEPIIGIIGLRAIPVNYPSTSSPSDNIPLITCEFKRLYVDPSARNQGVATLLIERAIEAAKELGYNEIKMDTLKSMTRARELYKKHGFQEIECYYDTPYRDISAFYGRKI